MDDDLCVTSRVAVGPEHTQEYAFPPTAIQREPQGLPSDTRVFPNRGARQIGPSVRYRTLQFLLTHWNVWSYAIYYRTDHFHRTRPSMADSTPPKPPRRSSAADLLTKLLAHPDVPRDFLSTELAASSDEIAAFAEGTESLSLDQQARIASIAIERAPSLARAGHRLAAQVDAARRYHLGETERHNHDGRPRNIW